MLYMLQVDALVVVLVAGVIFTTFGLIASSLAISRRVSRRIRRARFIPHKTQFLLGPLAITLFPSTALPLCPQVSPDSVNPSIPTTRELPQEDHKPEPESKRVWWIIPNYRTSPSLRDYMALTPREKFKIATSDSIDRGTLILAAAFAEQARLADSMPSFGNGTRGYARYLATSYADFVIGNVMTEAIYPTILHQDPRYFRRGSGGGWSRFGYAVGQIIRTHADSGNTKFNFSEIVGNSTAVAISIAYYPDNRDGQSAATKLANQIGVDMVSNILKEFWPDLHRKFARKQGSTKRGGASSI